MKKKEREQIANYKYDSNAIPTKPEARKILESRGVHNAHVVDIVYDMLVTATEEHGIPANRFLFANGIHQTLKSYDAKEAQPLPDIPDEPVLGELLNPAEINAIWDASISWREELTFDEFLKTRRNSKTDCFFLGKEILGKDFAQCHRVWTNFFPKFEPKTLPPNYTQRQMIQWIDSQSMKKDFLLLASRNSFKSSWSHVWLLSLILCVPDVRILLVSETKQLSKDFIGAIRSYFEVIKGSETWLQKLFPEYCIPMGDGSVLSLDCPMAHLRLAQSIESTSMDSAVAGRRADVIVFDDPISSTSCGNEVQRKASVDKYDALKKLREVGGLVVVLGTPWHEADLYAELLHRNEEDEDKPLAFRIDPAFTVNDPTWMPKFLQGKVSLRELTESDVTLLFPERLTWKFLQSELKSNEAFFCSQNLVIFPKDKDADQRCTFDEDLLLSHIRPASFFATSQTTKVVLSVDTAFSISKLADFSCLTTTKIMKKDEKMIAVVADVDMDRWTYSELARHIVEAIARHRHDSVVIEKNGPWSTLNLEIQKAAMLRSIPLPHIFWRDVNLGGTTMRSKASRIKALEPLLADDQLWFAAAHWNDACIGQLLKFDGITRSNSSRKDDFPDSLALGIQCYFPHQLGNETAEKTDQQKEAEKAAREEWQRREYYRMYFGSDVAPRPPEPEEPDTNPLFRGHLAALKRRS